MSNLTVGILLVSGLPRWLSGKESASQSRRQNEPQVPSLGQDDPLEKDMETHFSTLAWRIPWIEEPSRLQSMGSQNSPTEFMD